MNKAMQFVIGILPPRELLLFAFIREGVTTTKELARKSHLTPHEAAKLCRNMAAHGYLVRRIDGYAIAPVLLEKETNGHQSVN